MEFATEREVVTELTFAACDVLEGDTGDVHLDLDRDDLIDIMSGPARSLFTLDYL